MTSKPRTVDNSDTVMRIAIIDEFTLPETYIESVRSIEGVQLDVFPDAPIDDDQIVARAENAEIAVVDVVTKYSSEVLSRLPKLQTIVTLSVGVDHIDVTYCKTRGIEVINFPGYNSRAVAEAVFAYLLSLLRRVPAAWQHVLGGGWNTFSFDGAELSGKTMGVIGAGNVGSEVTAMARALSMDVLCTTRHPSLQRARSLGLKKFVTLAEVLENSDFVTLAVPRSPETDQLISRNELRMMKESAILINVSRWQVVDIDALAEAIFNREIAGAALDVIAPEPYNLGQDSILIQELVRSPNVLLLPHVAFNTAEALMRLGSQFVTAIESTVASQRM